MNYAEIKDDFTDLPETAETELNDQVIFGYYHENGHMDCKFGITTQSLNNMAITERFCDSQCKRE